MQSEIKSSYLKLIEQIFQEENGRVVASLIGFLKDFELAQDVLQEAYLAALEHWPQAGLPPNPAAWLYTTARRKALDRLRRATNLARKQSLLKTEAEIAQLPDYPDTDGPFADDRLKLIFTCCHPALNLEARVALTLHTLGGLNTAEIAHAFLVSEVTMAQRLVRAKRKIKEAGIPYIVPARDQLAERLDGVLAVIYLIFNAGYTAIRGVQLVRREMCSEAIRLCQALLEVCRSEPDLREEPESLGLLALMMLHDARREARLNSNGEMLLLEEQDRTRWKQNQISEGEALLDRAMSLNRPGQYQIQAAISALHCQARQPEATDWYQISVLYAELNRLNNSPVIRLNWAVAVAMATSPARGLELLAQLETQGDLKEYYLFHTARADLLRRDGDWQQALAAYRHARTLTHNTVELAFLQRRMDELQLRLN